MNAFELGIILETRPPLVLSKMKVHFFLLWKYYSFVLKYTMFMTNKLIHLTS
jgi:hypothetical protein